MSATWTFPTTTSLLPDNPTAIVSFTTPPWKTPEPVHVTVTLSLSLSLLHFYFRPRSPRPCALRLSMACQSQGVMGTLSHFCSAESTRYQTQVSADTQICNGSFLHKDAMTFSKSKLREFFHSKHISDLAVLPASRHCYSIMLRLVVELRHCCCRAISRQCFCRES